MFIDTHCHLNLNKSNNYNDVGLQLLKTAKEHQVSYLIDIATDVARFQPTLDFANSKRSSEYSQVFNAIAIHPLHILDNLNFKPLDINQHINNPKLVAIGETGIDYHYSKDNLKLQHKFFETHCEIATANNLPIMIHTRDAQEDTLAILNNYKNKDISGVIHCFSGNKSFAQKVLDLGFYISFSGIVTFKKSIELQEVAKYIPLESILTETDAPFLAPVPFRGKDNQPAYVSYTAKFIAELRQENLTNFTCTIKKNSKKLFSKITL